jgi:hypothetical protein
LQSVMKAQISSKPMRNMQIELRIYFNSNLSLLASFSIQKFRNRKTIIINWTKIFKTKHETKSLWDNDDNSDKNVNNLHNKGTKLAKSLRPCFQMPIRRRFLFYRAPFSTKRIRSMG